MESNLKNCIPLPALQSGIYFMLTHHIGILSYRDPIQKVDSAIHRINHYPVDDTKDFVNTYPLDRDLSGG